MTGPHAAPPNRRWPGGGRVPGRLIRQAVRCQRRDARRGGVEAAWGCVEWFRYDAPPPASPGPRLGLK